MKKKKEVNQMKDCPEEKEILLGILKAERWHLRKVAKNLRIPLPSLKMVLKRYGIREV